MPFGIPPLSCQLGGPTVMVLHSHVEREPESCLGPSRGFRLISKVLKEPRGPPF